MIEAIGDGGGVALAARDPRAAGRQRGPGSRRRIVRGDAERIEIDDALAAVDLDGEIAGEATPAGGGTITAIMVARRLIAAADRGLAAQARLGPAAVRRLVRDAE